MALFEREGVKEWLYGLVEEDGDERVRAALDEVLRVRPGDRVTWLNCDEDQHTSTADAGQWASGLLSPGDGFTQSFPTVGEFPYHCEPHPFMTGRVVVE